MKMPVACSDINFFSYFYKTIFEKLMARYNILLINFSKKTGIKFQKLLDNDFEFWTSDKLQPDIKIHLVLIHWKSKHLCDDIILYQQNLPQKAPVFLIASFNETLLLQCFQNGIDDFIDENWTNELLKAKILSFFNCRKKLKKDSGKKIKIGNLTINPKKRKVFRKGKELSLTKIEYDILTLLANDMEKIFSRDEIYEHIWGRQVIVGERTLDVHMNNLRKKIGKSKIRTKKGFGFGINSSL